MKSVVCLYKPVGLTPLQSILKCKEQFPEYKNEKVSFAGRLDPMAEGLLLLLVGDENKKRKEYEKLDKAYECSVLFGISTDSYDILGIPKIRRASLLTEQERVLLYRYSKTKRGKQLQRYPPFSSKPVNGKPLYYWARKGELDAITLPTKEITVTTLRVTKESTLSPNKLLSYITTNITKTKGDFRQDTILQQWTLLLDENPKARFSVVSFHVVCSSGTYIRSIAHSLGEHLGIGAIALSIERTHIGSYTLADAYHVEYIYG